MFCSLNINYFKSLISSINSHSMHIHGHDFVVVSVDELDTS
ncbi:multicopper oxidase domain-containing protein [Clostridium folliculivorans]